MENTKGKPLKQDPYCYPGTAVLENKRNITDYTKLKMYEYASSEEAAVKLKKDFLKKSPRLDQKTFKKIHKKLFKNVYKWAGKNRTVDMSKGFDEFTDKKEIGYHLKNKFEGLERENYLKGLDKKEFVNRIANYYNFTNKIHPFREGNGRTMQLYYAELGRQAGYDIDFKRVNKIEYLHGVKEASNGNIDELKKVFNKITERSREINKPNAKEKKLSPAQKLQQKLRSNPKIKTLSQKRQIAKKRGKGLGL